MSELGMLLMVCAYAGLAVAELAMLVMFCCGVGLAVAGLMWIATSRWRMACSLPPAWIGDRRPHIETYLWRWRRVFAGFIGFVLGVPAALLAVAVMMWSSSLVATPLVLLVLGIVTSVATSRVVLRDVTY